MVVVGGLFVKVSKGSDLLRKPHALWFIEFLHGQSRMQVFMTLWETSLLGLGGVVASESTGEFQPGEQAG